MDRGSDFRVTLLNPSSVSVGFFDIENVRAGSPLPSSIPTGGSFPSAITLSDPGTYTLVIRGGDFLGADETGNHTAIDDLSIEGTVVPIPESSTALFSALALLGLIANRRRK